MLAREIMSKNVVTVAPQTLLRDVAELFDQHGISGAPVVAPGGGPVGMISKTDLLAQPEKIPPSPPRRGAPDMRVEQVMTPWCVSLEEDAPIAEVARQMAAKGIHRVVITREGAIAGIVTALDVVRALLRLMDEAPR